MPTFVEMTPDAFGQGNKNTVGEIKGDRQLASVKGNNSMTGEFNHVRRPVRGLVIKDDTYGVISVRKADGKPIPLLDSGGYFLDKNGNEVGTGSSAKYSNFLIQNIAESRAERQQIVQTFGEPFIFFFGENPRMLTVSGILLNSADFNWRAEWWENYDRYLRGTQCVRNRTRVYLSWDDIVVEGYILASEAQETSAERNWMSFSFQLFITQYSNISNIGSSDFPTNYAFDDNGVSADLETSAASFVSSTQAVRQLNAPKQGGGGLLDALRQGLADVLQIGDSLIDLAAVAQSFLGGRKMRVPIGFAGGTVFDDVQIALGSIDVNTVLNGGQVTLLGNLGGNDFTIQGDIAERFTAVTAPTGKIYQNTDEYIASTRGGSEFNQKDANALFTQQLADPNEVEQTARDTFELFGVPVDPPSELLSLAKNVVFGIVQVVPGAAESTTGASISNLTAQVL